jgi:hypothetical protein
VRNGTRFDDPGALSGVLTGVSFVSGLAIGLSLADAPFPRPGADVKDVQRFFLGSSGPERINVTGQLLSATSLAVFSRSVARLAGRAGKGSGMLQAAAITGGAVASASLAASRRRPPRSPMDPASMTIEQDRYTDFCLRRAGRCMAPVLRCCSVPSA